MIKNLEKLSVIPGTGQSSPHSTVSVLSPSQSFPPKRGAGLLHNLTFSLTPLHFLVHFDHAVHFPHSPSTKKLKF